MSLHEQVAASMRALEPMLPTLTGYARAMTGNPEIVAVVGPKTQTDGKRIMVRPPLALAALPEHERRECGSRRSTGELSCPACATREDILVKMRHEIGHVIHGSLARVGLNASALTKVAEETELTSVAIKPPRNASPRPLMWWAQHSADPNVATLVLALEDIRVDRANASTSDGGAAAYRIFLERILATGGDAEGTPAIEHPLEGQVLLGMLSAPHGVDLDGLIGDEALEVLEDDTVRQVLGKALPNSAAVIGQAFRLYRRLIDLGVFPDPEPEPESEPESQSEQEQEQEQEPEQEPEQEQEQDDEKGDEDSDDQAQGPQENDSAAGDAGDEESGDADSEDSEAAPGPDDSADAPMRPEDLRELIEEATGHNISLDGDAEVNETALATAISQAESHLEHLGGPEVHMGKVNVYGRRRPDGIGPLFGRSQRPETMSAQDPTEGLVGSLVGRARTVFAANAMVSRQRNATRGRVSPTVLGKRAWNPEDQRLFERRQRNDAPSYSVLIGMDNSGSTSGGVIAQTLREAALAAATMCQRVGVEVSVYAHTTGGRSMDIYELKAPDAPWSPRLGDDLRKLDIGSTNYDGSTMRFYRRTLEGSRATHKVLLYFTDGYIPGAGGAPEERVMREEVAECRKRGVTLLGVGAHTSSPEDYGIPTVRLDKVEDIRKVLEFLAKEFGV